MISLIRYTYSYVRTFARPLLLFFMLTATLCCHAKREPSWMRELPKPGNETYIYVRESGEGKTVEEALAHAMVRVFQSTANRLGQPFDSQKVKNSLVSGTDYKVISQQYEIPVNRVGVYSTQLKEGVYWVYVLCQVAAMGNVTPVWDRVGMNTRTANWVALAKSAVVPGLGQMGKDHVAEGLITLVGEGALVGGGLLCYNVAQDQLKVMRTPNVSVADFADASSKYSTAQTLSYVTWSAAGALYLFNLIRAFTVQPKSSYDLTFQPSFITTPNQVYPSMGLTLRF